MQIGRHTVLVLAALMSLAASVRASEGTIDLRLDPAASNTINSAGSYKLVADVTMTAAVNALTVNAADVSLDLGGHTITGTGGATIGINSSLQNITIFNGTIAEFGSGAIALNGAHCRVIDVRARASAAVSSNTTGIFLGGARSSVERCNVFGFTGTTTLSAGIQASGVDARVIDCTVTAVDSGSGTVLGIYALNTGAEIRGNRVRNTGIVTTGSVYGIRGGSGRITGNAVVNIGAAATGPVMGIYCQGTAQYAMENNVVASVGNTASQYTTGIRAETSAFAGQRIIGNVVSKVVGGTGATNFGIYASSNGVIIERNTVTECQGSLPAGGSFTMIACQGDAAIRGNLCRNNDAGATMRGIDCGPGSIIEDNSVTESSAVQIAPIYTYTNCIVRGNVIRNNSGTTSGCTGIRVDSGSTVEFNTVGGVSTTSGQLIAISAATGTDCIVRYNTCVNNDSSATISWGIDVGAGSIVQGNTITSCNGTSVYGIRANGGSTRIVGNTIRDNDSTAGTTTGIFCTAAGILEGNVIEGNNVPSAGGFQATGIRSTGSCVIRRNQSSANGGSGSTGLGAGIQVDVSCLIEDNLCDNNDGAGTGVANGIYAGSTGNRIVNNLSSNQTSGTGATAGIALVGSDNFVAGNTTAGNGLRGITVSITGNRTESNRSFDPVISGGSGLAGDLADVQIP